MNISRSLCGALSALMLSVASLILAGCGAETKDGPAASAPANGAHDSATAAASAIAKVFLRPLIELANKACCGTSFNLLYGKKTN